MWWTWANALTAVRLVLIVPTTLAILAGSWWPAAALFTLAAVTDFYDGVVARKLSQMSPLGGFFDHATDAVFVTAGCWALAQVGLVNPYLHWLIPLAFVQYALDSKALAGKALRTSTIGRSNGVAYFVAVGTGIGASALGFDWLLPVLALFAWLLVLTTVVSMFDRAMALVRHKAQ